jgi:hypothetical protein
MGNPTYAAEAGARNRRGGVQALLSPRTHPRKGDNARPAPAPAAGGVGGALLRWLRAWVPRRSVARPTCVCCQCMSKYSMSKYSKKTHTAHRKIKPQGDLPYSLAEVISLAVSLSPHGPIKDFRLILSRSKVMTSFLLTFTRELSTTEGQF